MIAPAFIAITQMWYRRREQPMRLSSWYAMNGVVNMVCFYSIVFLYTDSCILVWQSHRVRPRAYRFQSLAIPGIIHNTLAVIGIDYNRLSSSSSGSSLLRLLLLSC